MFEKLKAFLKERPYFVTILLFGALGMALLKSPDPKTQAAGATMLMITGIAIPIYALA